MRDEGNKGKQFMRKKYKKNIELEYKYVDTPDTEQILEAVYDKLFAQIIQEQKKLRAYFKSEQFRKDYKYLLKKKSILADFLSIH